MPKKGHAKKAEAEAEAAQPDAEAAATKDWKDTLTEEERQREEEKARERQAKAEQAQAKQAKENASREWREKEQAKTQRKQQRDDREWERGLEAVRARALKEGVLVSQEWDSEWYVDLGADEWKKVQGQYFCRLCEKHLHDHTLESHLVSENHAKKLAWSTGSAMPEAPAATRVPCAPAWGLPQQGQLEEWQELTADGMRRCIPCGKLMDGTHESTDIHRARVEDWVRHRMHEKSGYPPPDEPYLAWVPQDSGERWLKCLLCQKWVNDEAMHCGSQAAPAGSKDHQKNLRNYGPGDEWYEETVTQERLKYHPAPAPWGPWSRNKATPVSPGAPAAAVAATPAPWAQATAEVFSHAAEAAIAAATSDQLIPGWEEGNDDQGRRYYFNRVTKESRWEKPILIPLPDGWAVATDDRGAAYYFNRSLKKTQWDHPSQTVDC